MACYLGGGGGAEYCFLSCAGDWWWLVGFNRPGVLRSFGALSAVGYRVECFSIRCEWRLAGCGWSRSVMERVVFAGKGFDGIGNVAVYICFNV